MWKADLEAKVLNIIERVEKGQPIEDSLVECKSEWIDHAKAARRLAGHANAARGEPILWLIGVDDGRHAVPGAPKQELSQWWPQVAAHFDGLPPELQDLNVVHSGATVVALWFETDRAPYVVKNPKQDTITHEVPWRDGTRVRSATREDVVRILVPLSRLPSVEALEFQLAVQSPPSVHATLYFVAQPNDFLCFPNHQMSMTLTIGGTTTRVDKVTASPPILKRSRSTRPLDMEDVILSETISATASELLVRGPGKVLVWGSLLRTAPIVTSPRDAIVNITMGLAGSHRGLNVRFGAHPVPPIVNGRASGWEIVFPNAT